jgi:hypothetical protein
MHVHFLVLDADLYTQFKTMEAELVIEIKQLWYYIICNILVLLGFFSRPQVWVLTWRVLRQYLTFFLSGSDIFKYF